MDCVLDSYQALEKIGEGTYGIVYRARNLQSGKIVALKKVRIENDEEGIPPTALRETALLLDLKHPNIVNLYEIKYTGSHLYLIFEYLNQDLKMYMDERKNLPLKPETCQSFLFQLLRALEYCHAHRISHRDLKPQNILVDHQNHLKLADFGLARAVALPPTRVYTHEVITLWYRPPEILLGSEHYSFGVDIWSTGCIFAEMMKGGPLFPGDSEIDQLFKIFQIRGTPEKSVWFQVEELPDYTSMFPKWQRQPLTQVIPHGSDLALHLLDHMLEYDPNFRYSARFALSHPYFQGVQAPQASKP